MLKKALLAALPLAVVAALGFGGAAYADEPTADVAEPEVAVQEVAADVADEPVADVAAQADNGWIKEDGSWHYYVNGVQAKGWKQISGTWYFFDLGNGNMATGYWCTSSASWAYGETFHMFAANGAWVNKSGWYWNDVDYAWAYLMNGECVESGWKQINGKWYHFSECCMETGWLDLGYDWYCLGDDGAMKTGWFKYEGENWYYAQSNGKVVENGWASSNGKWYYIENYDMVSNCLVTDAAGKSYYLGSDGAMATGWFKMRGKDGEVSWYYAKSNGVIAFAEWVKYNNKWYYIDSNYGMATGFAYVGGEWYFFEDNGVMVTNKWVHFGNYWYYQMADGKGAKDWCKINGSWYYFIKSMDYAMAADTVLEIDGVHYTFDENGHWHLGVG